MPKGNPLPPDFFNAFNDDPTDFEPGCLFCFKWKEEKGELYCSRRCAISHTLHKLTGGNTTQEDWDYLESRPNFIVDPERPHIPPPSESLQPGSTNNQGRVATAKRTQSTASLGGASARLFERLAQLGKLDDELTIDGLIDTLEDNDNADDSGESSSRSIVQGLGDMGNDTKFAGGAVKEDVIIEKVVNTQSFDFAAATKDYTPEELEELSHLGLASKLRRIYDKATSLKRGGSRSLSGRKPPTMPSTVVLESPIVIPDPSGDEWHDFLHIQHFLEKSGLGGMSE